MRVQGFADGGGGRRATSPIFSNLQLIWWKVSHATAREFATVFSVNLVLVTIVGQ